jgi:hypothetical protein
MTVDEFVRRVDARPSGNGFIFCCPAHRDHTPSASVTEGADGRILLHCHAGCSNDIILAKLGLEKKDLFPASKPARRIREPITDQQSRLYSNQLSQDAVESMEVITGVPTAEYGDKSSLIVHIVTRSGLNQPKPAGTAMVGYGSFRSPTAELNLGAGSKEIGDFFSLSSTRTDRYLDAPEFTVMHGDGSQTSFFDRLDIHPTDADSFHVNIQAAKSSFAVPNTFDQQAVGQDQHQSIDTFNVAPGYVRVLGSKGVLTANGFVRRDHLTYTPSPNPFADLPGTVSQDRTLTNFGGKVDFEFISGRHDVKTGGTIAATRLHENFTLGVTDPTDPTWADASGNFDPAFAPYDLTNGGSPFVFSGSTTIKTQAAYIQDTVKAGNVTFNLGLRVDHYDGLSSDTLAEPRLGASYLVQKSGTVLRASYGRTLETPYNENLLLSSGFEGAAALVGSGNPPPPGRRNEGEFGIQQGLGRWVVIDFGYFNKHTVNGYDFSVLFNTPIVFPVSWDHSRLNGFTGRINLIEHKGLSAYVVMAHTNAVFSPPATGGVLLQPPPGDFRIDHDQKFNSTTNVQYTFNKRVGAWATLAWRYDSGLVAGSVPDYATALTLTANQQATIGLFCGSVTATLTAPITGCNSPSFGATRVVIPGAPANPAPADDVANPPRIAPRHLFDLAVGADNLFNGSKTKVKLRFSVVNLMNKEALYNFLSTFSGTHFVTPRAYQVQIGLAF